MPAPPRPEFAHDDEKPAPLVEVLCPVCFKHVLTVMAPTDRLTCPTSPVVYQLARDERVEGETTTRVVQLSIVEPPSRRGVLVYVEPMMGRNRRRLRQLERDGWKERLRFKGRERGSSRGSALGEVNANR